MFVKRTQPASSVSYMFLPRTFTSSVSDNGVYVECEMLAYFHNQTRKGDVKSALVLMTKLFPISITGYFSTYEEFLTKSVFYNRDLALTIPQPVLILNDEVLSFVNEFVFPVKVNLFLNSEYDEKILHDIKANGLNVTVPYGDGWYRESFAQK